MIQRALFCLPLAVMACAPTPMSEARAEAACQREVGLADGVAGQVRVGAGSGGARGGVKVVLTDRVFNPQTSEEFMAQCIAEKTGRAPVKTTFGVTLGASS